MLVAGFPAGPWGTNCYVLAPSRGSECVVVDPGKDAMAGVEEIVREQGLRPVAVVLTHGHIDHMWSVVPVASGYGIPAWIHPADRPMLADPAIGISGETRAALSQLTGGSMEFTEPDDVRELADGEVLAIAGLDLVVAHAPGHTAGSTTFGLAGDAERPPLLVSGDVLFAGSIGRTDLPGGSMAQMQESLRRVVLPLDDATVVLPGHGETTTIGQERRSNPYLLGLDGDVPAPVTRGL